MIEQFTVENYRSYQREEVLSFVASNKEKNGKLSPEWYKEIGGKRILRLLICVGLNGTGKSKMFSALNYLRMIATSRPEKPSDRPEYRPFLLDDESRYKPTILSLTYYTEDKCYYYKVQISRERVEEEELRDVWENELVYHRKYNAEKDTVTIKFGPASDLNRNDQRLLEGNVIQNSTVLSVYGSLNIESRVLRDNYDYFIGRLSLVRRSEQNLADRLQTDDPDRDRQVKKLLLKLLQDVGTNIVDYFVDDTSFNVADLIKSGAPELVIKAMQQQYPSGVISHKSLRFVHSTANAGNRDLDAGLESFGTMNIVRLLVVMYDIVIGRKSSCIDEIETGIHTKALAFILKMYLSIAEDSQIAVATHDLSLLEHPVLRRDAVRMFEKDDNGHTYIKKRVYVHNSINLLNVYKKDLDPKLDELIENVQLFVEYRDLIRAMIDEIQKRKPVKK